MAVKRNQTFHETLIPLLVEGIGAHTYLEFGTHLNETIGKVKAPIRYGVDTKVTPDPTIHFFEMTTKQFIEQEAEVFGPYDFVFIDADHSCEAVLEDFHGIWPHVSDEGIICLHDTNPETSADTAPGLAGTSHVAAWILDKDEFESVTLPYHPGLTIVRKRLSWGPAI